MRADAPPPPWQLQGAAYLLGWPLSARIARRFVPPAYEIVPLLPGRTAGGLYLGRYGTGSTLEYSELIFCPALVRRQNHVGFWIARIYVDDARSRAGGRRIWGLPKETAHFRWRDDDRRCDVHLGQELLCSLSAHRTPSLLPLPLRAPALSTVDGRPARFVVRGSARTGLCFARLSVPAESPLAPARLPSTLPGVSLRGLDLTVPAPMSLDVPL